MPPDALDAALSLPDGMSPGRRTQNRSLRYKRLERPAHRVSGERQNARYFFADVDMCMFWKMFTCLKQHSENATPLIFN